MSDAADMFGDGGLVIPRQTQAAASDADATAFAALRAFAISRAQAASGLIWTDYNLHDPGLTVIEAVCYAMTALVYRVGFDVPDHLRGEDGRVDFERQALFAPHAVFPSRATTGSDIRRVLLDQDPLLRDVRLAGDPSPEGLHHLRLLLSASAEPDPTDGKDPFAAACERARAAYWSQRGLGEDVDDRIDLIDPAWLRLRATIELEGARDPEDVAAEIFDACDSAIAPPPGFRDPRELSRAGWSLDAIFAGPRLASGYLDEADLGEREDVLAATDRAGRPDRLPLSDLRLRVLAIDGVADVGELALELETGAPEGVELSGQVLRWNGEAAAPRLRGPSQLHHTPDDIRQLVGEMTFWRRGVSVQVAPAEVAARCDDLRAGHRRRQSGATQWWEALEDPFEGRYRAPPPFHSVGDLFPGIYGLGPRGAPPGTDLVRTAERAQFQAYLSLYDQLLASAASQIDHTRDLFCQPSQDDHLAVAPTYWPQVPYDQAGEGPALTRRESAQAIGRKLQRTYDDPAARRHQVLDYLLALYGETLPQNTLSQFLGHLDSIETAEALIENKAAFLKLVVDLSRDRAAGFDCGAPLWTLTGPDPTPGFQSRIALLLGFRRPRARRLAAPLTRADSVLEHLLRQRGRRRHNVPPDRLALLAWPGTRRPTLTAAQARDRLADAHASPEALFQLGVDRRAYRWRADEANAAGSDRRGGRLLLGSDDPDLWWSLGDFADEREAGLTADWLRHHLLELTAACEGLHVVEHILLRPRADQGKAKIEHEAFKVTLVFPGWTARTQSSAFRRFAEETARISVPAHLVVETLWLDPDRMGAFDETFGAWLQALRTYGRGETGGEALDQAAAEVLRLLRPLSPAETARSV